MLRGLVNRHGVAVLDGALGTQVERKGYPLHEVLWSANCIVENQQLLVDIHADYFASGADIITTAAYQVSYEQFHRVFGFNQEKIDEVLRTSTMLALKAREEKNDGRGLVAASIGCFGAHLANGSEYSGQYGLDIAQLKTWHQRRFEVLANSGADLIACETIPCLAEAKAELQLFSEHHVEGWLSVACRSPLQLNSGESIEDFVRLVEDCSVCDSSREIAIGVNCTNPGHVEAIILLMREIASKSRLIVAYPNEGSSWDDKAGQHIAGTGWSDDQFASLSTRWYDAGARVIGGCCSTTPSTINAIRNSIALKSMQI